MVHSELVSGGNLNLSSGGDVNISYRQGESEESGSDSINNLVSENSRLSYLSELNDSGLSNLEWQGV